MKDNNQPNKPSGAGGIVHSCTCQSEYQDKTYGRTNRVMAQTKEKTAYRCSVCGREVKV